MYKKLYILLTTGILFLLLKMYFNKICVFLNKLIRLDD